MIFRGTRTTSSHHRNSPHSPGFTFGIDGLRRAAAAQPRALLAVMVLLVMGSAWLAVAQRAGGERQVRAAKAGKSAPRKPLNWNDLPRMVNSYAQERAAAALSRTSAKAGSVEKAGIKPRLFSLTEVDLTPGNTSDEREPAYRTSGDYIAFCSNGTALNGKLTTVNDGGGSGAPKYHIWIMKRDGSNLFQVTGLREDDKILDQSSPSWSPDGNSIVYVGGAPPVGVGGTRPTDTQLFTVKPFVQPLNTVQQLTFFAGDKRTPSWSPAGTTIAFVSNVAPGNGNAGTPLRQFDIFTIDPRGSTFTVRRLTGDPDGVAGSISTQVDPQDVLGNSTDDFNPEFSLINPSVVFFSSNRENGTRITGRRIMAMNAFTGSNKRQITDPLQRARGTVDDVDDQPSPSLSFFGNTGTVFAEHLAFQTTSKIDASDTKNDLNIWSLPIDTSDPFTFLSITTPVETSSELAVLESNRLSSPTGVAAASFNGAVEDVVSDQEPTFSRSSATLQLASQIVFASQRRNPSGPSTTNPINPGGPTAHDIWTTALEDFAPPLLIPLAVGNQIYPFIAPGPQAPFFAPRVAEEGLTPGGKVIVACVIKEQESGLFRPGEAGFPSVTVSFKDADRPRFVQTLEHPNADIPVSVAVELSPQTVAGPLAMQIFDDGPATSGGHERQASAVKGDGIYYCQGSFATVDDAGAPLNGEYYIDLTVADRNGNGLTYDNVFGFSTRPFSKNNPVLLVSDYTVGQQFPIDLEEGLRSQGNILPTESYYLTNPGGTIFRSEPVATPTPGPTATPTASPTPGGTPIPTSTPIPSPILPFEMDPPFNGPADPTSFDRVDVWRVLSRGEVPEAIMDLYQPLVTDQIDPNVTNPTQASDFSANRKVAVAESAVVWATPYTGGVFAAPGTLYDANTQQRLIRFLDNGGRLFVSGKDVIFALSNAGNVTNGFLENELHARWSNEMNPQIRSITITGTDDPFIAQRTPEVFGDADFNPILDPPAVLHTPYNLTPADDNSYADACFNHMGSGLFFFLGGNILTGMANVDFIEPVDAGTGQTVTTVYNYGSEVAGHRIEATGRGDNKIESRVVFFSFGFEAINREYRIFEQVPECRNFRSKVADNIVTYLQTGRVSGRVVNSDTNQPIANFLMQVSPAGGGTRLFLARTDANGDYEIAGIPAANNAYRIGPATYVDANNVVRSLNGPYFTNIDYAPITVRAARTTTDLNFRINPIPPATIIGRAISDKGTPLDTADDPLPNFIPAPNMPVMIRSVLENLPSTDRFPGGGQYAALVATDAAGNYVFSNVPVNVDYEIIFNPKPGLINKTNPNAGGDIPAGSGINYGTPTSVLQPSSDFGRRVIPADALYPGTYTGLKPISIPPAGAGSTLNLGDTPIPPRQLSGRVLINGQPANGAKVELLPTARVATTDSNGLYSFDKIAPGTYTVRASLQGGQAKTSDPITVTAFFTPTVPDINLTSGTPQPTARPTGTPVPTPVVRNGKIAFSSKRDGNDEIYTMNADGTAPARITLDPASDSQPGFSPDGKLIAFSSKRDGNANIYLVNADGSGLKRLTSAPADDVNPTFNPDGRRIAFTSYRDGSPQVYIMNADGTGQARLTPPNANPPDAATVPSGGQYPAFSPDGNSIVYSADRDIWIMNIDGSGATNLTRDGAFNYWPRFNRTGTRLVYTSFAVGNYEVYVLALDGTGKKTRVSDVKNLGATFAGEASFSPDGTRITFTANPGGKNAVYAMNTDGSKVSRLTNPAVSVADSNPSWGGSLVAAPTPTPVPSGSPTPKPTAVTFVTGSAHMISIPYMDSTNVAATTTVDRAFSVPLEGENGPNYDLSRYNPLTAAYEPMTGNSVLRRGEGYFIRPLLVDVSIVNDASRKTLPVSPPTFDIILRKSPSRPANDPLNGFNLIGFPFDPNVYRSIDWLACTVKAPDGTVYPTLDSAVGAGLLSGSLTTRDQSNTSYIDVRKMAPFKAYWAKTNVNGVTVTLKASTLPPND